MGFAIAAARYVVVVVVFAFMVVAVAVKTREQSWWCTHSNRYLTDLVRDLLQQRRDAGEAGREGFDVAAVKQVCSHHHSARAQALRLAIDADLAIEGFVCHPSFVVWSTKLNELRKFVWLQKF